MTLLCIDNQQSSTHKGNFLQGGKQPVTNLNQNANHRRNSCSSPLPSKATSDSRSSHDPRKLERSNSEDGRRSSSNTNSPQSSNSSRYKTELCRPFEENGTCKYGDKCQFAHGMKELRTLVRHPKYKTELCRTFHSTGLCPYGPRCHFIHNSEQTKKSMMTNLTGSPSPSPPVMTRSKALSSLGSSGEMSPTSSQGGSPTGMKSFDDLFQNPMMANNGYSFPQDFANMVNQSFLDHPAGGDPYDSVGVFGAPMVDTDGFGYQGGTVLDLFQMTPVTPTTPLDANASFFRLPIFDLFHKQ